MIQQPAGILPWDFEPSAATMGDVETREMQWEVSQTEALRHAARKLKVGLDRFLLAALARSCQEEHGHKETLISLESYGRPELFETIDITRTIGWFTALFPVVIHAPQSDEITQSIASIDQTLKTIPNQGIGWGVLKYLSDVTDPLISKMHQVTPAINFNYLGEFDAYDKPLFQLAEESSGPRFSNETPILHDLDINVAIVQRQLHVVWHFNSKRFAPHRMDRMLDTFTLFLKKTIESFSHMTVDPR